MAHLIDKDVLTEKLWERRTKHCDFGGSPYSEYGHEDDEILSLINTLEVKEINPTDAFIEMAVSYLEGTLFNEVCYGEIRPDIVQAYINDFKKAMEQ